MLGMLGITGLLDASTMTLRDSSVSLLTVSSGAAFAGREETVKRENANVLMDSKAISVSSISGPLLQAPRQSRSCEEIGMLFLLLSDSNANCVNAIWDYNIMRSPLR